MGFCHGGFEDGKKERALEGDEEEHGDAGDGVTCPKVAVADAEDVSEEEMVEAHFHPSVFDEGDADCEGDDVESGDGGFLFDP